MIKITRKELYNTLENFRGKKQYLFATFKGDINYYIDTLKDVDLTEREKHISDMSRIINDFKVLANGFKINDSNYYFSSKTNIYKIEVYNYVYIILHKTETNSIVVYENIK